MTDETAPYVLRYGPLVEMFIEVVDRENGSLFALPYSGGWLEQPYKTMQAIGLLQSLFSEKIREEMKRIGKG